jgi:hypothetical protein
LAARRIIEPIEKELGVRLPQRVPEHVAETASWKLFNAAVPAEWIVREVTERDYGIDCYMELSSGGYVTGDLCSIQLKGEDGIPWKGERGSVMATFSGVKIETVNYWMRLPVPVLLVVTDIKSRGVYFVNPRAQVRERYNAFLGRKSMSFNLSQDLRLDSTGGPTEMHRLYMRERKYRQFASCLIARLGSFHEDLDFIYGKQGCDEFMEIESSDYFRARDLVRSAETLARFLGIPWDVPRLDDLAREGRNKYGGTATTFHYGQLDELLVALEPRYFEVIEAARVFVTKDEGEFWHAEDLALFEACFNLNIYNYRRKA